MGHEGCPLCFLCSLLVLCGTLLGSLESFGPLLRDLAVAEFLIFIPGEHPWLHRDQVLIDEVRTAAATAWSRLRRPEETRAFAAARQNALEFLQGAK